MTQAEKERGRSQIEGEKREQMNGRGGKISKKGGLR